MSTLPDLAFVRDLEAFEGPILSEYVDAKGMPYLQKWCTYENGVTRYLVVRSRAEYIDIYIVGLLSMLDLLTIPNDDRGWLVDRVGAEVVRVEEVRVSKVPDSYLPEPCAMHDEDLRPVGFAR